MKTIKIATDFSDTPGARYESEGPNSGARFRDEVLLPAYEACVKNNEILQINLDDCYGYATSFLEESFGGLVRVVKEKGVLDTIEIVAKDDMVSEKLIKKYVAAEEKKL